VPSLVECRDTLLMFLVDCEKIYVYVSVLNADVVVAVNYESIFSESKFVATAKLIINYNNFHCCQIDLIQ